MADKEKLKDMLDAIIDDNSEKAEVDFHEYLGGKMRDAINPEVAVDDDEVSDED